MNFDDQKKDWDDLLFVSSAETSQSFLLEKYRKIPVDNATTKSFDNCYPFIYYLDQGKSFFHQAKESPLNIKPILLFYGLVFHLKACLLTVDPNYPDSTSVLAHGVSTRKRKKQNYNYLDDEVKLQKNGLFPHFSSKMFHMKQLEGNKYSIRSLLIEIPELSRLFEKLEGKPFTIPIIKEENKYRLPNQALDFNNMTHSRLLDYLKSKSNYPALISGDENSIYFSIPLENESNSLEVLPFRYHLFDQNYYLIKQKSELSFFNELMIHYLLLYHLSMIARYEIEWWSELIYQKPGVEYPIIIQYLQIAIMKCPYLINQFLFSNLK